MLAYIVYTYILYTCYKKLTSMHLTKPSSDNYSLVRFGFGCKSLITNNPKNPVYCNIMKLCWFSIILWECLMKMQSFYIILC